MWLDRRFAAPWVALLAAVAAGCGDTRVSARSCTNFSEDTTTGGTRRRRVDGCDGTVIVIVHDAPAVGLESFHLTIARLELISQGRTYVAFEGDRREDLLAYRGEGFLLVRRHDAPEVDFDAARLRLADPACDPPAERSLVLRHHGDAMVVLDEPLGVRAGAPARLVVDIDVDAMLASAEPGAADTLLTPVVRIGPALESDSVPIAPMAGSALRVEEGRVLLEAEPGGGTYWLGYDPATGGLPPLANGDRVQLEGVLEPDGTLRAWALAAEQPRDDSQTTP